MFLTPCLICSDWHRPVFLMYSTLVFNSLLNASQLTRPCDFEVWREGYILHTVNWKVVCGMGHQLLENRVAQLCW